ncbi:MAG: hypothetical protein P8P83_04920 [Rickettsiaceae bacterium]|nr:hypothetical protein [Rickettsiaceae bacterium]
MNKKLIDQQAEENIFVKYKKWFIAAVGVQMIPGILLLMTLLGMMIYNYVDSAIHWTPYKQNIYSGYNIGLEEGIKDKKIYAI